MRPSHLAGTGCTERTSCSRREERRMRVSAGDAGLKLRLPPFMCKHLEGIGRDQHYLVRFIRSFERGKQGRQDLEEEGVRHVLVGALLGKLRCRRCGAQAVEIFPERCMGTDQRGFRDDWKRSSSGREQKVRLAEDVAARCKAAAGLSGTLRDRPPLLAILPDHREDEVLLLELYRIEHDCLRVERAAHCYSSASSPSSRISFASRRHSGWTRTLRSR